MQEAHERSLGELSCIITVPRCCKIPYPVTYCFFSRVNRISESLKLCTTLTPNLTHVFKSVTSYDFVWIAKPECCWSTLSLHALKCTLAWLCARQTSLPRASGATTGVPRPQHECRSSRQHQDRRLHTYSRANPTPTTQRQALA